MYTLRSIDQFDSTRHKWTEWREEFEIYEIAAKYHKEEAKVRVAFFLHMGGREVNRIYKTFTFETPEQPEPAEGEQASPPPQVTLKQVLDKFDNHFKPYHNLTHATYVFNSLTQKQGQSMSEFITDVQLQADLCEFGDTYNRLVRDRIICGTNDGPLRERLLTIPNLSLKDLIDKCKAAESSKQQDDHWVCQTYTHCSSHFVTKPETSANS